MPDTYQRDYWAVWEKLREARLANRHDPTSTALDGILDVALCKLQMYCEAKWDGLGTSRKSITDVERFASS